MIRRRTIEIGSWKRLAGMGGKVTPGSLAYTEGSYSTAMTGRGMWRSMSRSMEGRCPGSSGSQRLVTRSARGILLPHAILVVLVLAGCEPPDHPPMSSGDLPPDAVAYLEPERVSTFNLEEGVVYRSIRSRTRPWNVHLIEVDAGRCELGFRVVRADEAEGRIEVSEMARRSEPGVIAAINGDFFTPEDTPLGVEVSQGQLRGRTSRPVFAWRPGEVPWVGPVEWGGDSLRLGSWAILEKGPGAGVQVVAGFPSLLEGGVPVGDLELSERPQFSAERHPRTAVGFDPERGRLWLVVADGRREGVSEGMTLPELAGLFRSLGALDAINLDGGGSSVMVISGEAVSRPSGPGGERPVVNGLIVRRDEAYCTFSTAL